MLILIYLSKAIAIGFAIAAPLGPICMLCIRRTLELGVMAGIAVGIGAALADFCFSLIVALGLTSISNFLTTYATVIKFIGGVFLMYLAYQEIKTKPILSQNININSSNLIKMTCISFWLTIINPLTVLTFIVIFSSIVDYSTQLMLSEALMFPIGIFCGSMIWWFILSLMTAKIKHRVTDMQMNYLRYFSAVILAGFGIFCFV